VLALPDAAGLAYLLLSIDVSKTILIASCYLGGLESTRDSSASE
jgi:hypothetical protein